MASTNFFRVYIFGGEALGYANFIVPDTIPSHLIPEILRTNHLDNAAIEPDSPALQVGPLSITPSPLGRQGTEENQLMSNNIG